MGTIFVNFVSLVLLVELVGCSSAAMKVESEKIDRRGSKRSPSADVSGSSGDAKKGDLPDGADVGEGSQTFDGANGSTASIERTFINNPDGQAEYKVQLNDDVFEQEIILKDNLVNVNQKFDQVNRPMVSDAFKQGSVKKDQFEQIASSGLLDILIVMDNSGSMSQEQAEMANRMEPLLQSVSGANWRIGVVTTDPSNRCMSAVISKGDANAAVNFSAAMKPGVSGSGTERGIEQAVAGLSCGNNAWVRANSTLAVLIVSDEDNCSNGLGCGGNYKFTPSYFMNELSRLGRIPGQDARVYGIFWQPDTSCPTAASRATQYNDLVTSTGGVSGSVCASSYKPVLQSISQNIAQILKTQFELSSEPKKESVSVTVNGQAWANYTIAGKVITFNGSVLPSTGSVIEVSYESIAEMQLSSFPLSATPAVNEVEVKVNGVVQAANTYTIDYASRVLKFISAPAPNAQIAVSYRTDVALKTDFSIGTGFVPASIKVSVNNAQVNNFSYIAASGVLQFLQAPVDGAHISVDGIKNAGPVLSYPFNPVGGSGVRDLSAVDKATQAAVPVTLQGNNILVPANEFKAGKIIVLRYRSDASHRMDVELPFEPIDGSLVVEEAPGGCALNNGISYLGRVLHIACEMPGLVRVSFKHIVEAKQEYVIDGLTNPEKGKWDVYVDGDATTDYVREGAKIIFNSPLPTGATVLIRFSYGDDV